jgi:predicted peptidase
MPTCHYVLLLALTLLAPLLLLGCASTSRSDSLTAHPRIIVDSTRADPGDCAFAIYLPPNYDPSRKWPAILFLHGRGESGTNGTRQLVVGLPEHVLWASSEWPFVIVMPQKPTQDSQWEDYAPSVLAILDDAIARYSIDPDRIALTGLSQGGHGCWTINAAAPGRFAAIAPVCGYSARPIETADGRTWPFDPDSAQLREIIRAVGKTPVWIFHGEADSVVPVAQSQAMADLLRSAGADVRLTTYPGVNHDSWNRAYSDPDFRAWLVKHTAP